MARFYGPIGYAKSVETTPGDWNDEITERNYYGDVLRNTSRWGSTPDSTNDNLNVNVQISIVADPYAEQNFSTIKYVEFMGTKWKVTDATPQHPRIILTLGGVYNG